MAVKSREPMYEEDSSDIESSSHDEEEEYINVELHELHKRISQTYPLSEEAMGVLHKALLSLDKQSKLDDNSLLSALLLQLKSLRTLIPPTQGDEGSTPCVINGALNYMEQLSKVIESLKEGMQEESTSLSGGSAKGEVSLIEGHSFCDVDYVGLVKVESISDAKLRILVQCKKRAGLLSILILTLDTLGLVIDNMDISCTDVFMLDAITTQIGEKTIDDESVREALWKIIHEGPLRDDLNINSISSKLPKNW